MKANYLIAGLIICTILFWSLADAQLLSRSEAIRGTEVPFCLPGENKVCTLGPPPVCHCEPQQVGSQSNDQSTSSSPILTNKPIDEIKPIREQGTSGQTGTTNQAGAAGQVGIIRRAGTTTVINFDDLVTEGWGTGGPILVTDQYASRGVTFSGARAIDYSKGEAIPGFVHSGNIAIEACYGSEFCTDPIEMIFNQPQSSIKVWVGIDTLSTAKQKYVVELSAFDATGQQVGNKYAVLNPTTGPAPIQTPIQVSGSNIVRATVSYAPPSPSYNNGLAIDDVEFETPLFVEPVAGPVKYA